LGQNESCKNQGSTTLQLANAAGIGINKDAALMDLMSRIIAAASNDKKHSCDNVCDTGINIFCFTTVQFDNTNSINYTPGSPTKVYNETAKMQVDTPQVIAQYTGKITLTCHCFGIIQWLE
jgi:hypothetical protein